MTVEEIRAWQPTTDPDVMRNLEMLREIAAQLAELNYFLHAFVARELGIDTSKKFRRIKNKPDAPKS